jgi:dihydrofolate reductase
VSGITLIAAVARNGIIGNDNEMPWHLPADLKRFRELTMGHAIIMGRLTYESIGGALPGRTTIVLSRDPDYESDGVVVAHSPEEAVTAAGGDTDIFVVGGEQVYRLFLPLAQRMELTIVDATPDGDAVFPAWDHEEWRPTHAERVDGDPALDFITLERVPVGAGVR